MKNFIIGSIILIVCLALLAVPFITFSNQEVNLRTKFESVELSRVSFYDNMQKTISMKTQVAVKNDDSFKENIAAIMEGRKDGEQVMWKWVKEVNPNANFSEVSKLYQELSLTIDSKRTEFVARETLLADIRREHDYLLKSFPNSLINMFLGRKPLELKIIQSDTTKEVFETGIDNDSILVL